MAAYRQYRPQERTLGMVMNEVDKNLALFLQLRNRENEKKDLNFDENWKEVDDLTEMKCEKALVNVWDHVDDRSDLDCLSTRVEKPMSLKGQHKYPQDTNSSEDSGSLNNKSMHSSKLIVMRSSVSGNNSSTGRRSTPYMPLAPTVGSSLPAMKESTRQPTPVSRASFPSTKALPPAVKSSTPIKGNAQTSTPTSRTSIPSNSKSTSRSVTPTTIVRSSVLCNSKSLPRSLTPTPTARTSLPTTTAKSKSRSATPTAKSYVPSTSKATSRSTTPPCKPNPNLAASSNKSSKVELTGSTISKNPVPSRGASSTVKSRPSNLPERPGLLRDAPDLTTSMIKRSNSASRGQPGPARSSTPSNDSSPTKKPRQHSSCSPSRGRLPNLGVRNSGSALLSKSQGYSTCIEDVNPVLLGTQMVERLVNMRKLAPPRQADNLCERIASKKSSISQENTGFGRSLSKKSLDMAIRHMDITRSIASAKTL